MFIYGENQKNNTGEDIQENTIHWLSHDEPGISQHLSEPPVAPGSPNRLHSQHSQLAAVWWLKSELICIPGMHMHPRAFSDFPEKLHEHRFHFFQARMISSGPERPGRKQNLELNPYMY